MLKYLNSFHNVIIIICLASVWIIPQKKESGKFMPEFYRDDITKPIKIDILSVEIRPVTGVTITPSKPEEFAGGYFFRYLNSEKNSRLLSEFKSNKIWEIKWQAALETDLLPWFLLLSNDRIIVQNESGFQMFDTNGKSIFSSSRTDGNLSIDTKNNLFYHNEFSGFLAANRLDLGVMEFLVYPYLGKGYDRNIVWYNENKFMCVSSEIPAMTHKSSLKEPEITLFEVLDTRDKSMIDSDKILNSAQQIQKLIMKARFVKTAVSDGTTVAASENFITIIDQNLDVKKIFNGDFNPIEISIDNQLNIFMICKKFNKADETYKFGLMVINQNGELLQDVDLPFQNENPEFYPPILTYDLNTFILADNRLIFIDTNGKIKWDNFLAGNSPGVSVSSNGYLIVSEDNLLSAFDNKGERKFIFTFDSEKLYTPPIITPQNEIYVATKNFLYCLTIK